MAYNLPLNIEIKVVKYWYQYYSENKKSIRDIPLVLKCRSCDVFSPET